MLNTDKNKTYTEEDMKKDLDNIFNYVGDGPKLVMCARCGTQVEVGPGVDCKCGYLQELATLILKESRIYTNEGAVKNIITSCIWKTAIIIQKETEIPNSPIIVDKIEDIIKEALVDIKSFIIQEK